MIKVFVDYTQEYLVQSIGRSFHTDRRIRCFEVRSKQDLIYQLQRDNFIPQTILDTVEKIDEMTNLSPEQKQKAKDEFKIIPLPKQLHSFFPQTAGVRGVRDEFGYTRYFRPARKYTEDLWNI